MIINRHQLPLYLDHSDGCLDVDGTHLGPTSIVEYICLHILTEVMIATRSYPILDLVSYYGHAYSSLESLIAQELSKSSVTYHDENG